MVIVTGASRGIGRETARQFAGLGDRVALVARSRPALNRLAREITAGGGNAIPFATDLTDPGSCDELIRSVSAELGAVDVCVLGAGVSYWVPIATTTDAQWASTMRLNLDAVFYCARAALLTMLPRKSGQLIFLSSILAHRPAPNLAAYASFKAAVVSLAEALAAETKRSGINITVIEPGTTATTMRHGHGARPRTLDISRASLQLAPKDVADAIVWASRTGPNTSFNNVTITPKG